MRREALIIGALAACGGGGGFPDAYVPPPPQDPGTVAVDWTLQDGSGSAVTCTQASATTVQVRITDEASGDQFSSSFVCALGGAVSGSLPSATYDLAFALLAGTTTIASAPAQTGIVVAPDMTAHLGMVVFVVSP